VMAAAARSFSPPMRCSEKFRFRCRWLGVAAGALSMAGGTARAAEGDVA